MTARIRIPLTSVATSPDHCVECDGPDPGAGRLCTDCATASLLQRIGWRYENGDGIRQLVDLEPTSSSWPHVGRVQIAREFHPLTWRVGGEITVGHDGFGLAVFVGPWTWSGSWTR